MLTRYTTSSKFSNIESFRIQLAKELIGDYSSRLRRGRGGGIVRSLPYRHFPIRQQPSPAPAEEVCSPLCLQDPSRNHLVLSGVSPWSRFPAAASVYNQYEGADCDTRRNIADSMSGKWQL